MKATCRCAHAQWMHRDDVCGSVACGCTEYRPHVDPCTRCDGTGEVEAYELTDQDGEVLRLICPDCDGTSVIVR